MKRFFCLVMITILFTLLFSALAEHSPIAKGSKGDHVVGIQMRLKELGYLEGKADGDFGSGTEKAVIAFQTKMGIDATGVVDAETFDALYDGIEGLISFKGIEWYSTKADVEQILYGEGARQHGWLGNAGDIYRMSATNYSNTTMGSDRVDDGGYRGWYAGISVAGYEVEDTYACYIYPIVDGSIIHDDELAEFYFGWYTFKSGDYSDHSAIYDDLFTKLSSIYGEGKIDANKYNTTAMWKDIQGNQIRLLINDDKNYVTLGYMAYGADARLDEMKQALQDEEARQEAELRENNASNTSGL